MHDIPAGRQAQQEVLRVEQQKYESLVKIKDEVNAEVERRVAGKVQHWEQEAEQAVGELQGIVHELEVAAVEDMQKYVEEVTNLASLISTAIQRGADMGVKIPDTLLKAVEEASQLAVAPVPLQQFPVPVPSTVMPQLQVPLHQSGLPAGFAHSKRSQNIPVPLNGMGIGGTITPSDMDSAST